MNWEEDVSQEARDWMADIGDFGPTINARYAQLKGYAVNHYGETISAYYDSRDLRSLAAACNEVADWLDKRAEEGE